MSSCSRPVPDGAKVATRTSGTARRGRLSQAAESSYPDTQGTLAHFPSFHALLCV